MKMGKMAEDHAGGHGLLAGALRAFAIAFACALAWACMSSALGMPAQEAYADEPGLLAAGPQSSRDYTTEWYENGTSPYTISSISDLKGLSHIVNGTAENASGQAIAAHSFENETVQLMANKMFIFQASTDPIEPIGSKEHPFEGTFDGNCGNSGNGSSINNLKIAVGNRLSYIGLFGYAGDGASIENLRLSGGSFTVTNEEDAKLITHVGAIAGYLGGSLENCYSSVDIDVVNNGAVPEKKGESPEELCNILYIGGLVGYLGGDLLQCTHAAETTLSVQSSSAVTDNVPYIAGFVGGIAGFQGFYDQPAHVTATRNCANEGPISFNVYGEAKSDRFGNKAYAKSAMVGGIVGYSMGNFYECVNSAPIDTGIAAEGPTAMYGASNCAGIVGSLRGPELANPTSSSGVVGSDPTDPGYEVWKGGSAPATLSIERCQNTASIVGLASVAGIAGAAGCFTEILGCANSGAIDGTRSTKPCPAGIVGITDGNVGYCSSTGRICTTTGAGYYASGIAALLTTYNTSKTPVDLLLDPPEIYGCYVTASIVSSASNGYRSGVIAGENDGFIHDNCFLANLTTNKGVPPEWDAVLGHVQATGEIEDGYVHDVAQIAERINILNEEARLKARFRVDEASAKLLAAERGTSFTSDGAKALLSSNCVRSLVVEADQDRGTQARNNELTAAELKGSFGVSCLNYPASLDGDWSDNSYHFLKSGTNGYPVLNWQGGGVQASTDLASVSGSLSIEVESNPQYSARPLPSAPVLNVMLGETKLYQNADFVAVVQPGANVVGQQYSVRIKGMNAYEGEYESSTVTYQVVRCDVSKCKVVATPKVFNWEVQTPARVTLVDEAGNILPVDPDDTGTSDFVWSLPEIPPDADTTGVKKYSDGKYYDYKNVHTAKYKYDIVVTAKPTSANYAGSTQQAAFHINWGSLVYGGDNNGQGNSEESADYDKVVYNGQEWDYKQANDTKGFVKIKYTGQPIKPTVNNPTYLGRPLRDGTGQKYYDAPLDYDFRFIYGNPNPDLNSNSFDCIDVTGPEESNLASMTIRFTAGGNFDNYANIFFEITPADIASDVTVVGAGDTFPYTGEAQTPLKLTYNGMTLQEGTDFTVQYSNNVAVGEATATITGKGNYSGTATKTFSIVKAPNPLKAKGLSKKVNRSKLKKKAQAVAALQVADAQGKLTYKLVKSKKTKKFKVNSKGRIVVPKKAAKGTYKVKVLVTVAGNDCYEGASIPVTAKIKVK